MTTIRSILEQLDRGEYLDKDGVDGSLADIQKVIEEQEHYETTDSTTGNLVCACGRTFEYSQDIEGHVHWQEIKASNKVLGLEK